MKLQYIATCLASAAMLFATGCSPRSGETATHESEEGHAHGGEIELTHNQMETVGIRLGSFTMMAVGDGVTARGILAVSPNDIADVSPLVSGIVKAICVTEGQSVNAGAVVARVENLDIPVYRNELKEAELRLSLARNELERQQQLVSRGAGIAKNLEKARIEAESAEALVESCRARLRMAGLSPEDVSSGKGTNLISVKSPISGIVTKVNARIGSAADMGIPLMTVTDVSGIYALLKLYEKDLGRITKGESVDLFLTNGSERLQGKVEEIIRSIDEDSKTIDVRVTLTGGDRSKLIPGMAVNATINCGIEETPVLPEEAVVTLEGKDYIYMLDHEEEHDHDNHADADTDDHEEHSAMVFRQVEVVKGKSLNGFVQATPLEPLPSDARIVVSKAFYIASMAADHGEHNH